MVLVTRAAGLPHGSHDSRRRPRERCVDGVGAHGCRRQAPVVRLHHRKTPAEAGIIEQLTKRPALGRCRSGPPPAMAAAAASPRSPTRTCCASPASTLDRPPVTPAPLKPRVSDVLRRLSITATTSTPAATRSSATRSAGVVASKDCNPPADRDPPSGLHSRLALQAIGRSVAPVARPVGAALAAPTRPPRLNQSDDFIRMS
jgi:hypothetical protein